jgi:hypothetical protein
MKKVILHIHPSKWFIVPDLSFTRLFPCDTVYTKETKVWSFLCFTIQIV